MSNKIEYLQSLITLEQCYELQKKGYEVVPGIDKFGNKIVTITMVGD